MASKSTIRSEHDPLPFGTNPLFLEHCFSPAITIAAGPVNKAYIKTFGCQMNEQDSAQMLSLLSQAGYEKTVDPFDAGLVLLNTCSIREKAVHKLYSDLGRLRPLKDEDPDLVIAVAGCVAEQEKAKLQQRFPYLDLVFGPDHIRHLPQMLSEVKEERRKGQEGEAKAKRVLRTGFEKRQDFEFVNVLPKEEETPAKAFVNIQKGCDNICSFCIVPFVRGREVSRPHQEIIDEINGLVERGVQEVMLLGQNVNSYGLKNTGDITFAELLQEVADKTKLKRLRFTTSHPKDVKDDLIDQFANNPILLPQFHLPFQSGSDRILKLMRRQYTREQYMHIVNELKRRVPDIRFSTDIIVGFPTETDDDFEQTLTLMKEVGFDSSFSFIYSPRPYTSAVKIEDDVPQKVKAKRLQVLQDLDREICFEKNKAEVGRVEDVLIEDIYEQSENTLKGRTPHNKIVHFDAPGRTIGQIVPVKITKANPYSLFGEFAA
ncbi:MAG: tRNA (N6-isopentenyl adenosine(37)-C2)-methylthiotransferase MiaB [Deltaproteobacteria bacterium]|nr:tRNA (N6-isopentenyl adenosine(37)-C2)-methylthiotransferase MiaB [Deltaproteobacteria bacterium]